MRKLVSGAVIFLLLLAFALLFPRPCAVDASQRLLAPSRALPFGTDGYGRDLVPLAAAGLRTSFLIASAVALLSLGFGVLLSAALASRNLPKAPFALLADSLKAVPATVLALFLGSVSGPGVLKLVIALTVSQIPNLARTACSKAPALRNEPFSMAAEAEGMGEGRIFISHILPHIWQYLLLQSVSVFSSAVLAEASLSFLGCGVPLSLPSLGRLLSESRPLFLIAWWTAFFPSALLFLTGLSLELVIEGVSGLRA